MNTEANVHLGLWGGGDGCVGVNVTVQMGLWTGDMGRGRYACTRQCIIHSPTASVLLYQT